jgi:hypothetical protein
VALKSVLEIDVRNEAFARFQTLFNKYQSALEATPGKWQKVGEAQSGLASNFERQTAALMAQAQLAREAAQADEKEAKHLGLSDRLWTSMAKSTKSVAGNIISATGALMRWTGVVSAVGGLLGAGGLWGIDRMAANVSNQRRTGMGLGMSPGEMQAFSINFGRLVDPNSFLETINEARANPAEAWRLSTLGVSTAGSTSEVALRTLDAMRARALATPENQIGLLGQQTGMDVGTDTWRRLHDMSQQEFEAQRAHYAQDVQSFATNPETNRNWQDVTSQFSRAGATLFDAFQTRIGQLAPELTHLSDALTGIGTKLINSPLAKDAVTAVEHGLNWLADKLDSPEFQARIEHFFSEDGPIAMTVRRFSEATGAFIDQVKQDLPAIAQAVHVIAHPKDTAVNWMSREFEKVFRPNDFYRYEATPEELSDFLTHIDRENNLPEGTTARAWQTESSSSFAPKDSPKGAKGPFQFMPRMAAYYRFDPSSFVDSANAFGYNIADIQRRNHWDLAQALAANNKNWGEGNMSWLLKTHPNDWLQYVPKETHDYVEKIAGGDPDIRHKLAAYNFDALDKLTSKDIQRSIQETQVRTREAIANIKPPGLTININQNTGGSTTASVNQLAY